MIIIEFLEDGGFAGFGVFLLLILIIALIANCSSEPAVAVSDSVDNVETVETVATIPEVVDLASLHVFGTHSRVLKNNIREGCVSDSCGKEYQGPYFVLTSVYHVYDGWQEAYTELVTGGNYESLSGTFFADADYDDYEIVFRIYADDMLVYDSGPVTRRSKPIDFEVSLNSADVVKVTATANKIDSTTQSVRIVLVDAVVHK